MLKLKNFLLIPLIILSVIIIGSGAILLWISVPPSDTRTVCIFYGEDAKLQRVSGFYSAEAGNLIPPHFSKASSFSIFARELRLQNKIKSATAFQILGEMAGLSSSLKEGYYLIDQKNDMFTIIRNLLKGASPVQPIVILPGQNIGNIGYELLRRGAIKSLDEFYATLKSKQISSFFQSNYGYTPTGVEGYLSPGLYIIPTDPTEKPAMILATEALKKFHRLSGSVAISNQLTSYLHVAVVKASMAQLAFGNSHSAPPDVIALKENNTPLCSPENSLIIRALVLESKNK